MQATMLALLGTFITAVLALVLVAWFAAWVAAGRRHHWQRIGIRILGSWSAASAILVLALQLVR
jgi:hypothetical protein